MTLFRRFLLPAALCWSTGAWAQAFENIDALERRVESALGAGVGEAGGPARPIDRRLKLASCPTSSSIEAPTLGAVTVRCEPLGWRLRVPLTGAAAGVTGPKSEPVIRKGDQVEVAAGGNSFTVTTIATAEQDGAPGDRIRLRADRKGAAFTGRVTAEGNILLNGFK